MLHKKAKKESGSATYGSVAKEMAKSRMAMSARIAKLKLDIARIPERPSTTMPGKTTFRPKQWQSLDQKT
jgi:hypothetical protein